MDPDPAVLRGPLPVLRPRIPWSPRGRALAARRIGEDGKDPLSSPLRLECTVDIAMNAALPDDVEDAVGARPHPIGMTKDSVWTLTLSGKRRSRIGQSRSRTGHRAPHPCRSAHSLGRTTDGAP